MYQYTDFDTQFVKLRAAQHRDQLERWQAGQLSDDEFRPLRLQNGWYVQRYAPMLRVAVPYGELSSAQVRVLAKIARDYDRPDAALLAEAQATQDRISDFPAPRLKSGYGHFSTRQNVQFNWIPLDHSADVMDLLASVNLHGIQTSGNCIRNITSDERAGIAVDEIADPRPFAEIIRQWSTLHPEFAFLPRKFKIAISGAREDRAATAWHDVGLQLIRSEGEAIHGAPAGELGFKVLVGGGMGRTPVIATTIREFLPWNQIMNYLEAVVRVYNRWGRRDNMYKARIKILVKAEGQRYIDEVEAEYRQIIDHDGAPHTIPQAELDRVSASFVPPRLHRNAKTAGPEGLADPARRRRERRRVQPLAEAERRTAPESRPARRHAVVQAPGPGSGRCDGRTTRHCRRSGRDLQCRRAARDPRPEPVAALGALRPVARTLARRAPGRFRPLQRPPADRHDCLPGR
jgi:sulfite reductase (NADPH) hemoprotein beta-component